MPRQPTPFEGIEMKVLYADDEGRSTILFKMAPGAIVPLHEHTALEQACMLEGSMVDVEGSCGPGDFVWWPGGNVHVAHAPNGALRRIHECAGRRGHPPLRRLRHDPRRASRARRAEEPLRRLQGSRVVSKTAAAADLDFVKGGFAL
jgi:hypothetical protein